MIRTKKKVIHRPVVVLLIGFVFLPYLSYASFSDYNNLFFSLDKNVRDTIAYPNIKDIRGGIVEISDEESRFMLQPNVQKNMPDDDIEKRLLSQNTVDELLMYAHSYIGTPYRYGGSTRRGIDCSAFVMSVYKKITDIKLPRTSAYQAIKGEKVSKSDLKKGDLVFFANSLRGRISHVGIVENVSKSGEVRFIHAARSKGVMVSSLKNSYWGKRFRYAKRILS